MKIGTQAGAETRVLISAALIGSGVGMALGAAYLAGGMAQAATDYSRAARIAQAADGAYTEAALQREAANPTVVRLARNQTSGGLTGQDRQAALLAARLVKPGTGGQGSLHASASELECLTQAVYFEARGETPRGQAAVAQVVLNRVNHPSFPKTVCGVVFQGAARRTGCQFSFACDGSMRRGREAAAWTRARKVAARALSGVALPEIGAATHFHTAHVSPNWGPRMRRVAQVGIHVFYRFNPRGYAPAPAREGEITLASLQTPAANPAPTEYRLVTAMVSEGDPLVQADTAAPAGLAAEPTPAQPTAAAPDAAAAAKAPAVKPPVVKAADVPAAPARAADASSHRPADSAIS